MAQIQAGSCLCMCNLIVVVQSLIVPSLNLTPITLRWEPDVKQCLTRVSIQIYAGTDPSYCLPSICPICRICSWHSRWITSHIKWNLAWCGTLWLTLLDAGVWTLNLGQGGPTIWGTFNTPAMVPYLETCQGQNVTTENVPKSHMQHVAINYFFPYFSWQSIP